MNKTYKDGKYTVTEYTEYNTDRVMVRIWDLNGKRHRENGPAMEYSYTSNSWCLYGKLYGEEGWKKEMRKRKLEALGI